MQIPCPDSQLFFQEGIEPVVSAFEHKKFSRLEELYTAWCTGKQRFPDGRWKLFQYGASLREHFGFSRRWPYASQVIKEWLEEHPESQAAKYVEAIYWRAYAWDARGLGNARTVSKDGWEIFRERIAKAGAAVEDPRLKGSSCPAPYALRISILLDTGSDEEKLQSIYTDAAKKFPQYHHIHLAMARHYDPRWGGSLGAYEKFASDVAQATREFEGMGMYARIYSDVDSHNGIPFSNDSRRPPFWKKLRAGYDDLIRLYPLSMHNLGLYVSVACRSDDAELYRQLRTRVKGYEGLFELFDPIDVCDRRHGWVATRN